MTGKVKWFDDGKGYGFLVPDGGGKDVFVHHSGIAAVGKNALGRKTLLEGAAVEFDVSQGEKGPKADNVRPACHPGTATNGFSRAVAGGEAACAGEAQRSPERSRAAA